MVSHESLKLLLLLIVGLLRWLELRGKFSINHCCLKRRLMCLRLKLSKSKNALKWFGHLVGLSCFFHITPYCKLNVETREVLPVFSVIVLSFNCVLLLSVSTKILKHITKFLLVMLSLIGGEGR